MILQGTLGALRTARESKKAAENDEEAAKAILEPAATDTVRRFLVDSRTSFPDPSDPWGAYRVAVDSFPAIKGRFHDAVKAATEPGPYGLGVTVSALTSPNKEHVLLAVAQLYGDDARTRVEVLARGLVVAGVSVTLKVV